MEAINNNSTARQEQIIQEDSAPDSTKAAANATESAAANATESAAATVDKGVNNKEAECELPQQPTGKEEC